MKRKGRNKASILREMTNDVGFLHFRLCHLCLYLNESSSDIVTCKKCGSGFSEDLIQLKDESPAPQFTEDPLNEWDEGRDIDAESFGEQGESSAKEEDQESPESDQPPSDPKKKQPRVTGLSVLW